MTINLYTMQGCPKCKILKNMCDNSDNIKYDIDDFKVIEIDPSNESDTDVQLLKENNIQSLPVLLVENQFMLFDEAMKWLSH